VISESYLRVDNVERVLCPGRDKAVVKCQYAAEIAFIGEKTSPDLLLVWIAGGIHLSREIRGSAL